jgi:DNA-directed RNA polymerase subunit M/transcription elongation factor TFIIS
MKYPRFSGWSLYDLPEFMRTGIIGAIFGFLMTIIGGFIFWPLIFMLAKDIAILPSFIRALDNGIVILLAWIIYLALNILIMMWGMTSILGWVFFIFALLALFPVSVDQEDKYRCQKCHRRYIDVEQTDVRYGATTTETTTTTWGDGDKEVKKSATTKKTVTYKATCPDCGHVRIYEEDDSFTRDWVSKHAKRSHSRFF